MSDPNAHFAKLRQAFEAIYRQQNRLIQVETALGQDALIVERLYGREAVNECFEFQVDCVAPSAQFELKALLGERMTLRLTLADGQTRVWHGYVHQSAFLGADGGLARYRLTLAPWLTFLGHRRNCLVFQELDTREIIERLLADYPEAAFSFEVTQALPKRSLCTQFRETDLEFVERLLAEEGLSYHFEHDQDASNSEDAGGQRAHHSLRIFDKNAETADVFPARIRFHRVSPTETEDAITSFRPRAQLAPNAAVLSAWDAAQVKALAASSAVGAADLPPLELYNGAAGNPRHKTNTTLEQSAEHTLTAQRMRVDTASGEASARQLAAGKAFTLADHASADGRYIVLAVEHAAANNLGAHLAHLLDKPEMEFGSYRNRFVCIPDSVVIVSADQPKPAVLGPESALVVGVADETITSQRDNQVKVQFPWQRGTNPNPGGLSDTHSQAHPEGNAPGDETAGVWVSVAAVAAGPNWGSSFVPRIGNEVLIDYLDGDIDSPVITGQLYNGQDTPPFAAGADSGANHPGTITGINSQGLDGSGNNQWVIDDAPGQLRQSINTSQANSQLNLGYLIDQNGATRGNYRGQGFELATQGWAALRAPQGLLLSATARERGASAALDVSETVAQLNAAQERAQTLSDAATAQQASALNANQAQAAFTKAIDPGQDGIFAQNVGGQDFNKHKPGTRDKDKPTERFNQSSILLDSPSTIASTTPASSLHYAGENSHTTTQGEAQHSAAATHSSVSGSTSSLFTHEGGIQAVAAQGPLSLQAHDDQLEILADDSLTVTSSEERINIFAKNTITLKSGQTSVTLQGGNITFACPGTFKVQGGTHDFVGPAAQPAVLEPLPTGAASLKEFVEAPAPTSKQPFSDQVRGTEPKKIDLEMAQIADGVYGPRDDAIGDWQPLTDNDLIAEGIDPALLKDEKTGFRANIYKNNNSGYVLAFEGTDFKDFKGDWWQGNIPQGLGNESNQYGQAVDLAELAKGAFGDNLVITGHSLGGGLASISAVKSGAPAVTFNAAGIHDNTLAMNQLDPAGAKELAESGLIRRYAVEGEILTWEQEEALGDRWLLPDAIGQKIEIPDPNPQNTFSRYSPDVFSTVGRAKHRVDSHSMTTVLESMQKSKPWAGP